MRGCENRVEIWYRGASWHISWSQDPSMFDMEIHGIRELLGGCASRGAIWLPQNDLLIHGPPTQRPFPSKNTCDVRNNGPFGRFWWLIDNPPTTPIKVIDGPEDCVPLKIGLQQAHFPLPIKQSDVGGSPNWCCEAQETSGHLSLLRAWNTNTHAVLQSWECFRTDEVISGCWAYWGWSLS